MKSYADRFEFESINHDLASSVRVVDPGASEFHPGTVISLKTAIESNRIADVINGKPLTTSAPRLANATPQLLGLTQLARVRQSNDNFGLKESRNLGRLIPAGTGFPRFQSSEVRINLEH